MRILVEAGTESEWVAQALEAAGHQVVVADPNYGPMYGTLQRRVKTDRRDTAALAEANRRGWYRPAHRLAGATDAAAAARGAATARAPAHWPDFPACARSCARKACACPPAAVPRSINALARIDVPVAVKTVVTPVLNALQALTPLIATATRTLEHQARADPIVQRLQTVPGVGPIVALTYRATLDDVQRFPTAGHASSSVGLVPREDSSADRRQRGHITQTGVGVRRAPCSFKRRGPAGAAAACAQPRSAGGRTR